VSLEPQSLIPLTDKYQTGTFNTVIIKDKINADKVPDSAEEIVSDFNSNIDKWFGCGEVNIYHDQSCMKVVLDNAKFQCIGYKFPETKDITGKSIIKIRLKTTSTAFAGESMMFRVRFQDGNGEETDDKTNVDMVLGGDYKDYYVDFTGKLKSAYSPFDGTNISKIKIFFNTKGNDLFTGMVMIDEVSLTSVAK